METTSRLRSILVGILNSRIHHAEQEIFDELVVHKARLLNVFDVGSRDPQQQRELESGAWHVLFKRFILTDMQAKR